MSVTQDSELFSSRITRFFVEHRWVGVITMVATLAWGWFSARSLPQQEDPTFPTHDALLITQYPGVGPEEMEKSVTTKLEAVIARAPHVEDYTSRTRAGVSVIVITLRPASKEQITEDWNVIRERVRNVALPKNCGAPELDPDFQLPATLLFSITGNTSQTLAELTLTGQRFVEDLKKLSCVGKTRLLGETSPEVTLRLKPEGLMKHQLPPEQAAEAILKQFPPTSQGPSFSTTAELLNTSMGPFRLGEIAEADQGSASPSITVETLHRGQTSESPLKSEPSVLLAVEMKQGSHIHMFDEEVRESLKKSAQEHPVKVEVLTVSDQPAATAHRIGQFLHCFIEAVIVVVLVALLLMDWRTALVVAAAIPLTLAMTVGGMALLGIPLQQISIAALIIALGMLVDDPVVAADGINRELAAGQPRAVASWLGPFRLRRAIFFGTLINIAAFLPLALLPGDMGAFIIALPVVITLALVSSRLVSMTFVPLLGYFLLRGQRGFEAGGEVRSFPLFRPIDKTLAAFLPHYRALLNKALKRPLLTAAIAYGLLLLSCGLTPFFGKQFFPAAERNQMLIDITLPDNTPLAETQSVSRNIAKLLEEEAAIERAVIVCGAGVPMFYYNVLPREPGSHVAQILINTRQAEDVPLLIVTLRERLDREITNARCIVKQLQQGPAMEAPIQIQLRGDSLELLREKADEVTHALASAGAYKVHDDLGPKLLMPEITLSEQAAAMGLTPGDVAGTLLSAKLGQKVATVSSESGIIPVFFRMQPRDQSAAGSDVLPDVTIPGPGSQPVPLSSVASIHRKESYPVISHIKGQRSVTIKAFAPFGELASHILDKAHHGITKVTLPERWSLGYGGEEKELKNSQKEMSRVMAISLALIALTMLVQFRSFTKSLVVMLTVPLGLIGAFVGLAVLHASFGFMALLAIVSLAGVIVSHIIVLSDFIEEARAEGMPLKEALIQAGLVRLRAVLATVFATVCGLIPLATRGGQLWQPLTAVHIFGLLFATLLTLLLLPVLYYLFCEKWKWIR